MAGMYSLDNQKMKIKKALDAAGVALKKKKKKNFLSGLGAYLRDNLCWEISLTTERKCQIYPSQNQDQRED